MRALSAALTAAFIVSATPVLAASSSSSNTSSASAQLSSVSTSTVTTSVSSARSSSSAIPALSSSKGSVPAAKDPCAGKTGKARGKCFSDTLNALAREHKAFGQSQRQKRDAWKAEHESMGVSPEFLKLRQEFLKNQLVELKAFEATQLAVKKAMNEGQKEFIQATSATSNGYTRAVTGADAKAAKAKCAKLTDDRKMRLCLRQALQIKDPAATPWFGR